MAASGKSNLGKWSISRLNSIAGDGRTGIEKITRLFGVLQQLRSQARGYASNGNLPYSYIFYRRFAKVIIVSVLRHKDIDKYPEWKRWCGNEVEFAVRKCEEFAAKIQEAYESSKPPSKPEPSSSSPKPIPSSTPKSPKSEDDSDEYDEYATAEAVLFGGSATHKPRRKKKPASTAPVDDLEYKRALAALQGGSSTGTSSYHPSTTYGYEEPTFSTIESGVLPEGVVGWTPLNPGGRGFDPWLKCGGIVRGLLGAPPRGEDETPLRPVHFPLGIIDKFLSFAHPNNSIGERGVETCGILCGKILGGDDGSGQLVVTDVIVPPQKSGADWVEMLQEEDLYMHCISNDLTQIGWIHTHPSQECFMSSYDVRTHLGFQTMLPEAIAVVVAPTDPRISYGIFRLVEPSGVEIVRARPNDKPIAVEPGVILYETTPQVKIHATGSASSSSIKSPAAKDVPQGPNDFQFTDISHGILGPEKK